MSLRQTLPVAVVPVLALLAAAPAGAITGMSPVSVSECRPIPPRATIQPGFTPAYYPVGGWYYQDVYGRRYHQYPPYGYGRTVATSAGSLDIHYTNVTSNTLARVDFGLVAKGFLVAEVRDVGTFSPGAEIKHNFGLDQNVFPLGTGLARCVPLHAVFKDGTQWTNRRLPSANGPLYRR